MLILLAMRRADARIHVEHDTARWPSIVHQVDPVAGASGCLPAAAQRLAVNQGPGPQETVQKSSVNKLAKTTLDRAATISNYGDSQKSHTRTNFYSGGTSRPACVVRTRKKCEVAAQAACRSNSGTVAGIYPEGTRPPLAGCPR